MLPRYELVAFAVALVWLAGDCEVDELDVLDVELVADDNAPTLTTVAEAADEVEPVLKLTSLESGLSAAEV